MTAAKVVRYKCSIEVPRTNNLWRGDGFPHGSASLKARTRRNKVISY
jgi:hypothetical protein